MIDWVDFIQVGATQYVAGPRAETVEQNDLDLFIDRKFKVSVNVCDPSYRPKDGDADFLDPGTLIYQLTGRPSEQLAARFNGSFLSYRAGALTTSVSQRGYPGCSSL